MIPSDKDTRFDTSWLKQWKMTIKTKADIPHQIDCHQLGLGFHLNISFTPDTHDLHTVC